MGNTIEGLTIYGQPVLNTFSYRAADALRQQNSLFDFARSRTIEGLAQWRRHFERAGVPHVVVARSGSRSSNGRYVLLKRQYVPAGSLKSCSCNPLAGESCLSCNPNTAKAQARKTAPASA